MTIKILYKQNRYFFLSYFILLVLGIFILITYPKIDGFILMNSLHHGALDYFFIPYTYLGDGWFTVVIAIILFFSKKRYLALMIISSFALSGIITQILKFFIDEARPAYYLAKTNYPYFIDGVTLHNLHSFPSGHTTSAFALAATLGFAVKNKNYSILFLLMAALAGYSRIYLGQHFMNDVLVGSIIGMLSAIFCWVYLEKFFKRILKLPTT